MKTRKKARRKRFAVMETGQLIRDEGKGPLGQEGERQNDQLAELELNAPEEVPPYRRTRG